MTNSTSLRPVAAIRTERSTLDGTESLFVDVWWMGADLDRPNTGGWGLRNTPAHHKLAQRLARAIDAGAVHTNVEIRTDRNGKTYVSAAAKVLGRTMNADLRRLGF